jgi:hypothetical protein
MVLTAFCGLIVHERSHETQPVDQGNCHAQDETNPSGRRFFTGVQSKFARAMLGSVAELVVRHARCPVLVARDLPAEVGNRGHLTERLPAPIMALERGAPCPPIR